MMKDELLNKWKIRIESLVEEGAKYFQFNEEQIEYAITFLKESVYPKNFHVGKKSGCVAGAVIYYTGRIYNKKLYQYMIANFFQISGTCIKSIFLKINGIIPLFNFQCNFCGKNFVKNINKHLLNCGECGNISSLCIITQGDRCSCKFGIFNGIVSNHDLEINSDLRKKYFSSFLEELT